MRRTLILIKNMLFAAAIIILIFTALGAIMKVKPVIVLSGSMEPVIGTGSLALINQRDTEIEVGDIIAFSNKDMWIAHRVVEITDEGYITKGDNNTGRDLGPVMQEQVQGTVICSIPKLGKYIRSITSSTGIIVVSTACVSMLLTGLMVRKEDASDENERMDENDGGNR